MPGLPIAVVPHPAAEQTHELGDDALPLGAHLPQRYEVTVSLATLGITAGDSCIFVLLRDGDAVDDDYGSDVGFIGAYINEE